MRFPTFVIVKPAVTNTHVDVSPYGQFDLAADADIEDVMFVDIEGVRKFLGLNSDIEPHGRKGKAKLKSLYKAVDVTQPYKSGERARNLIRNLSFDVIEERVPMDIKTLRQAVFGAD